MSPTVTALPMPIDLSSPWESLEYHQLQTSFLPLQSTYFLPWCFVVFLSTVSKILATIKPFLFFLEFLNFAKVKHSNMHETPSMNKQKQLQILKIFLHLMANSKSVTCLELHVTEFLNSNSQRFSRSSNTCNSHMWALRGCQINIHE